MQCKNQIDIEYIMLYLLKINELYRTNILIYSKKAKSILFQLKTSI